MPSWSLFVPELGWSPFCKCLKRNGGDDETRTRDLCRDRLREMVLQQLTRHARTAKRSANHTGLHELRVGLWVESDQPLNNRPGFVVFRQGAEQTKTLDNAWQSDFWMSTA